MLFGVAQRAMHVDTTRIVNAAGDIAQADDPALQFIAKQARRDAAHVAEALHNDRTLLRVQTAIAYGFARHHQHTARGGFQASLAAADSQGLAGNDGGNRIAHMHRVCIHDPGHNLRVGIHVGGGNVAVRADQDGDFGRVAAREAFEFGARHVVRVADDAALRATKWDAHHGALPGHPHRQRAYFVQRDLRAEADAAFGRAAIDVVLHAVAREHLNVTVVHAHGKIYNQLAFRFAQNRAHRL